jgi:hypothetical protein
MVIKEQPTCGRGLAEHSALPGMLGKLVAAVGEVLAEHIKALDLEDMNSKQEYEAYKSLVHQHREIARKLEVIAREMEGYRDLPMGKHEQEVMLTDRAVVVFENYIWSKRDLLVFLKSILEFDQAILGQMNGALKD